jgi:hypothetical protein
MGSNWPASERSSALERAGRFDDRPVPAGRQVATRRVLLHSPYARWKDSGHFYAASSSLRRDGEPAALVMATTCGMLQAISQTLDSTSPGEVLEQVNETLVARIPPTVRHLLLRHPRPQQR